MVVVSGGETKVMDWINEGSHVSVYEKKDAARRRSCDEVERREFFGIIQRSIDR